jgi:FkbM family methyltransferase
MTFIARAIKPWFVFRPQQIVRRALSCVRAPSPGYRKLPTSWGATILADPTKTIGHSIWTTGLFDLNVSETLCRLIRAGDVVVDAGANIGYMSVLAAALASHSGRVTSFEPNEELFDVLEKNLITASRYCRDVRARRCALGAEPGKVQLVIPSQMTTNDGLSYVGTPQTAADRCVEVEQVTLDDELRGTGVGLLKIDVEGAEPGVLRGASTLLRERRIRDIVFEDHHGAGSETCEILHGFGYRIFSLGRTLRGLKLAPLGETAAYEEYEAPSYVATIDEARLRAACDTRGWRSLRRIAGVNAPETTPR